MRTLVMDTQMAPEEGDSQILLANSESDTSDVEQPRSQSMSRRAFPVFLVGLALLGAVLLATHQSGAFLAKTNVEKTVELSAAPPKTGSTFYLIKHTFKSKDGADAWWKATTEIVKDKKAYGAWLEKVADAGFHNALFMPTAEGTMYCLWEAKEGKSKEDMQDFIDNSPKSPNMLTGEAAMINDVMTVPLALTGKPPVKPFFPERQKDRRLTESGASTFYLIKHDFTSKEDAAEWWKASAKLGQDPEAMGKWFGEIAKEGFHNAAFLPTGPEGPAYCLWEAEAGKTAKDMANFIDNNKLSPTFATGKAALINHVMPIVGPAPTDSFFGDARELTAPGSTFYVIKHTFKSKDVADAWWKVTTKIVKDKKAYGAWLEKVADAGFHNALFLPTAEGKMYCLWEAKGGKTKEDMQDFIDNSPISPNMMTGEAAMINDVMTIPLALTGKPPVKPFFPERRQHFPSQDGESTFYLIKHDFTSKDDGAEWWKASAKLSQDPKAMGKWFGEIAKEGFHNAAFLPTGPEGPMYCLWEAEAGKTAKDMANFIDKSELSPTFATGKAALINHVMPVVGPAPTDRFNFEK